MLYRFEKKVEQLLVAEISADSLEEAKELVEDGIAGYDVESEIQIFEERILSCEGTDDDWDKEHDWKEIERKI